MNDKYIGYIKKNLVPICVIALLVLGLLALAASRSGNKSDIPEESVIYAVDSSEVVGAIVDDCNTPYVDDAEIDEVGVDVDADDDEEEDYDSGPGDYDEEDYDIDIDDDYDDYDDDDDAMYSDKQSERLKAKSKKAYWKVKSKVMQKMNDVKESQEYQDAKEKADELKQKAKDKLEDWLDRIIDD